MNKPDKERVFLDCQKRVNTILNIFHAPSKFQEAFNLQLKLIFSIEDSINRLLRSPKDKSTLTQDITG